MIVEFIVTIILLSLCVAFFIHAVSEQEWGWVLFLGLSVIIEGGLLWTLIDATKMGNRETVIYSFPAETYKLEMVVTETVTKTDTTETESRKDTTYVLTGIEPIFPHEKDDIKIRNIEHVK